jgi:hypothetical protein
VVTLVYICVVIYYIYQMETTQDTIINKGSEYIITTNGYSLGVVNLRDYVTIHKGDN